VKRILPFAILAGCLAIGVLPALAANQLVTIRDFSFTPRNVAVLPGESVTWQADGTSNMHNVQIEGEPTPVGPPSTDFSGTRQFTTEGAFAYHCNVHPTQMRGTVYVNQTGTVPTPSPTASPTAPPGGGGGGTTPGSGGGPAAPVGSAAPVSSFRVRASRKGARVFLTLSLGASEPVRVRGTLRRGKRRVRRVSLLARPGRHRVRLPGKALKPGRYTLTLRAGELTRVVRFRVRAA
jgi:plastocyanin